MALTKLGPQDANTIGNLPAVGSSAPDFTLTSNDMKDVSYREFAGKNIVLNIFPSVDTGICSASVREFNKRVAEHEANRQRVKRIGRLLDENAETQQHLQQNK